MTDTSRAEAAVIATTFHELDRWRRLTGRALEHMEWGPHQTPSRVILSHSPASLRAYDSLSGQAPTVLLIPAPIKSAHIWDLLPEVSVVRRLLAAGIRVYLLEWERPGRREQRLGLADYADRGILESLDGIAADRGPRQVFLAGHSLGGTFAAIFAALHPERVNGLILAGAPLRFGPHVGSLGAVAALSPPAALAGGVFGNVPGSYLTTLSSVASPLSFQWLRQLDRVCSLFSRQALRTHMAVERWSLDEMAMPGRLYEEIIEKLYRGNELMEGRLRVAGRTVTPQQVRAPLLMICEARSQVVPRHAMLPFCEAAASPRCEVLWYHGDIGVALQHVGMMVGRSAHREIWPRAVQWIQEVSAGGPVTTGPVLHRGDNTARRQPP